VNIFYKQVRKFSFIIKFKFKIFSGELSEHLLPETREQFYLRHSTIDDDDIAEWGSYTEPYPNPVQFNVNNCIKPGNKNKYRHFVFVDLTLSRSGVINALIKKNENFRKILED
jgi:hypothetical protein